MKEAGGRGHGAGPSGAIDDEAPERYAAIADELVALLDGWAGAIRATGLLAGAAEVEIDGPVLEVRVPIAVIELGTDAFTWDHGTGRVALRLVARDGRLTVRVTVEASASWNATPDGSAFADATLLGAGLPWSAEGLADAVGLCLALPADEVTPTVSDLLAEVGERARHHCWCGDRGRYELADRSYRCERCFARLVAKALGQATRSDPPRWFRDRRGTDD